MIIPNEAAAPLASRNSKWSYHSLLSTPGQVKRLTNVNVAQVVLVRSMWIHNATIHKVPVAHAV